MWVAPLLLGVDKDSGARAPATHMYHTVTHYSNTLSNTYLSQGSETCFVSLLYKKGVMGDILEARQDVCYLVTHFNTTHTTIFIATHYFDQ